jgi:acetyl esterase/lipase
MSPQLAALTLYLRRINKPMLARETDLARMRARFERIARLVFLAPRGAAFREADGLVWSGPEPTDAALLHFHGGGFVMGSPRTHRHLAARLGLAARVPAATAAYRLAPEHPHPAQVDDALAAYARLTARGLRVAVSGDSAGGGLAFALVLAARTAGLPDPACVVAFSPWCDMTLSSPTLAANAEVEAMLPVARVPEIVAMRMGGADPADPLASPARGAFDTPPPALIFASRAEILAGDAQAMAEALRRGGGAATLVWDETAPHAWPIFAGLTPEGDAAVARAGAFIAEHLHGRPQA